jgi:ketosteroid isomerase-like protein
MGPDVQLTSGQVFYHRLSSAIESGDVAALESLYQPYAVLASVGTGKILQGRAAILRSLQETADVAGPVKPVSVETFLEHGDIICVEATQATRFARVQTYDIFTLRAGAIYRQFSGMISPRQPAAPLTLGPVTTPEQRLYHRYRNAAVTRDISEMRSLYRPDAVCLAGSLGTVLQGRDAIVGTVQKGAGTVSFKAVTCYLEAPDLICTEAVQCIESGMPSVPGTDVQVADIFLLRDGAIRYQFGHILSPRAAELIAARTMRAAMIFRAQERAADWIAGRRRW